MTRTDDLDLGALAKSLLVHLTVIGLCFVTWQCSEPRVVKMPAHVKAVVISKGSQADRPAPKSKPQEPQKKVEPPKKVETPKKVEPPKPVEPPKKVEPPKPVEPPKKVVPPKKVEPSKKVEPPKKVEPTKKIEPPKKPKPKVKPNYDDLIDEELDDLAKPVKNTASSSDSSTSNEVDEYLAGIRSDIERRWSRPPLSRNGMKVLLRIFLLPGGELNDVQVVESSGNAAFDRSAVAAVQKVGHFTVPSDPVKFDRDFRKFTVLFNPDDLTY